MTPPKSQPIPVDLVVRTWLFLPIISFWTPKVCRNLFDVCCPTFVWGISGLKILHLYGGKMQILRNHDTIQLQAVIEFISQEVTNVTTWYIHCFSCLLRIRLLPCSFKPFIFVQLQRGRRRSTWFDGRSCWTTRNSQWNIWCYIQSCWVWQWSRWGL